MNSYGFTVDPAHLSRDVVQALTIAGTKAIIPEMLESTLEHEILHEG